MSSTDSIYTDPFILGLQQFPMPEVPEDAILGGGKGELNPMWGTTHTKKTKRLMSELAMGKPGTNTGKTFTRTEEQKKTISEGTKKGMEKWLLTPEADHMREVNRQRWLGEHNPMNNPESVEKVRKSAFNKKPCPHCGMMGNAGTLARHIKARHS